MSSSTCERGVLMTGPVSRLQLILSSAVQLEFPPIRCSPFHCCVSVGASAVNPSHLP